VTEDGPTGPRSDGFLATVRELAGGIKAQQLLFGLALAVLLVGLLVPGLDPLGRLVVGLTALAALLLLGVVSLRAARSTFESSAGLAQPQLSDTSDAPVPELIITNDGDFLGGDEVASDLVVDLVDVPVADRAVRVRAKPLEDASFRRGDPEQFVRLRRCVRSYELSLGRLLRGSVHFSLKWKESELVGAVLELRSIELPAQYDREWWYVWSADNPRQVLRVGFDETNVHSVRARSYRECSKSGGGIKDVPPDEPIC
jgi:hypothetical protein